MNSVIILNSFICPEYERIINIMWGPDTTDIDDFIECFAGCDLYNDEEITMLAIGTKIFLITAKKHIKSLTNLCKRYDVGQTINRFNTRRTLQILYYNKHKYIMKDINRKDAEFVFKIPEFIAAERFKIFGIYSDE